MDEITRQVRRARRRLIVEQLIHVLTWTLLASLACALVGVAIPKVWPLPIDGTTWAWAWLGGAIAVGMLAGLVWVGLYGRRAWDAAVEIDHRFGLKERVSSALALAPDQRTSPAGAALMVDAERRVRDLDLAQRFRPRIGWHPLLPVGILVLAFLVAFFVPDARRQASASPNARRSRQVKKSIEQLRKRLKQKKKQLDRSKLPDAEALFTEFEKTLNDLDHDRADRKRTMVKLNNLTKQLADRRKALRDSERLRKQLAQLKGLQDGPAKRFARALKDGDMKGALDQLRQLSEQLKNGQLTEQQKKQLAGQIKQLEDELQKMLGVRQKLEQKKRDLEQKIQQLRKQGKQAAAAKLQRELDKTQQQLDQLDQQNPQLQKLQQMLGQMQQCRQALANGQQRQAAQQLDQIAKQLKEMEGELEQLETIDQLMDEIADAKAAMNCDQCDGQGCMACQGNNPGDKFSERPGRGMGPGRGKGDRPEEKTATGKYRTRVRAQPRQGEAIHLGDADGPNVAGASRAAIEQEVESALSEDPDPVVRQHLPRRERAQTKEYFERFYQPAKKKK